MALPDIRELDGRVAHKTLETTNALGLENSSARLLPRDTVCLSRTASIGFVTVLGVPMATSQDFVNWICGPELDPWYLAEALIASRLYLRELASGAIHKTIYMQEVETFAICVPDTVAKQRRIVATLKERNREIEYASSKSKQTLNLCDSLSRALMHNLFPRTESEARSRGWQWAALGDVLEQRNEVVHPRNNPTGTTTFVGLEHIERDTGRRVGSTLIDRSVMTGRRALFRTGDIVYGYLRPYLNKIWIAEFDGLCSVDQYVFRVRDRVALTEFVANYMRSEVYLSLAPIDATPGQLPRIRTEEVAATPIPLPSLEEQARVLVAIGEIQAAVDGLYEAAQRQLTEVDALQPALLRAAFSGAL